MNPAINVAEPAMSTAYARLISLLDSARARYRLIDHAPEGRTLEASVLRGHPAPQAAKCMVARIKIAKGTACHALAVIPGKSRRADLGRLPRLLGGAAPPQRPGPPPEALTGCVSGSILPFVFDPDLHLIMEPDLLVHQELFFKTRRACAPAPLPWQRGLCGPRGARRHMSSRSATGPPRSRPLETVEPLWGDSGPPTFSPVNGSLPVSRGVAGVPRMGVKMAAAPSVTSLLLVVRRPISRGCAGLGCTIGAGQR